MEGTIARALLSLDPIDPRHNVSSQIVPLYGACSEPLDAVELAFNRLTADEIVSDIDRLVNHREQQDLSEVLQLAEMRCDPAELLQRLGTEHAGAGRLHARIYDSAPRLGRRWKRNFVGISSESCEAVI